MSINILHRMTFQIVENVLSAASGGKCYFQGDSTAKARRIVCLTFDDGPTAETIRILKAINGMKTGQPTRVTFFWLADRAEKFAANNPELFHAAVDLIKNGKHEIGLHGDYRKNSKGLLARLVGYIDEEKMKAEKRKLEQLIGTSIRVVRPHNWIFGPLLNAFTNSANRLNMRTVMFTLESGQRANDPASKQIEKISAHLMPGFIITVHEKSEPIDQQVTSPLKIVPVLVKNIEGLGLKMVTVSELLNASS